MGWTALRRSATKFIGDVPPSNVWIRETPRREREERVGSLGFETICMIILRFHLIPIWVKLRMDPLCL